MGEKFTQKEIVSLRSSLMAEHVDKFEVAQMIRAFVARHGYGIGTETACEVAGCFERTACNVQVLHMQLEAQALAM